MYLHDWLDAELGRATWLAAELDRSRAAVSLWRTEGVPLHLIPRIVALTGGDVTADEMLRHALERKTNAAG